MNDENLFERLCNQIDAEYSILSDAARNKLKDMLFQMSSDAFERGRGVRPILKQG